MTGEERARFEVTDPGGYLPERSDPYYQWR
jgi:hypothetical protein